MKQKKLVTAITGLFGLSALCLNVAQAGGGSVIVDSFSDVPEVGLTTLREALDEINSQPNLTLGIEFDETVFHNHEPLSLNLVS